MTHFNGLPLELRCNKCVPADVAMAVYDDKVKLAGQKLAQALEGIGGKQNLQPLERLVRGFYDVWGGEKPFLEDVVSWTKDLGSNPRTKGSALGICMKILALHSKVDRLKKEDDWKQMDDATLKATLTMRMMALMAEAEEEGKIDSGKKGFLEGLTGTND